MHKLMLIRHAEKPLDGNPERGVSIDGSHGHHELTVRGWQRAGALARFFAPHGPAPVDPAIAVPRSIFASAAAPESPSLRAQHTVQPLAAVLGLPVDGNHADGEEAAVVAAALAAPQPALIAWHHHHIPVLGRLIAGSGAVCPAYWPDDRFDLVWVFDRAAAPEPWRFRQVPQRLFAYDRDALV